MSDRIRFIPRPANGAKELATHDKPFVISTVLVSVTGLQRVILDSIVKLTGRKNLKQMPSRAETFDWLAAVLLLQSLGGFGGSTAHRDATSYAVTSPSSCSNWLIRTLPSGKRATMSSSPPIAST